MVASSTAFGLDIESQAPLRFLDGTHAQATGRKLVVGMEDGVRGRWPESAELVCYERDFDGAVVFQIHADPLRGYLIAGPQYGAHRLSPDGCLLSCDPEGTDEARWQRLLIAQVLPFAAVLRGLEAFHASAVLKDGRAVAFVGRSGAGKSSLALELCRHGATLIADDVLALEILEQRLMAHPGTPLASIAHDDVEHAQENVVAVNPRERLIGVEGVVGPAPLGALFFLERLKDGPSVPRFEPLMDAQMLLSATFNFVLSSPERLQRLLEVCSMAAALHVERVSYGPATDLMGLGAAVEQRLAAVR